MFVGFLFILIFFNVEDVLVVLEFCCKVLNCLLKLNDLSKLVFFVINSFFLLWYVILLGYFIFVFKIDWILGWINNFFIGIYFKKLSSFFCFIIENFIIMLNIFVIFFLWIGCDIKWGNDILNFFR